MKKKISMVQISNFPMNQKDSAYFYLEKTAYLFFLSKQYTEKFNLIIMNLL
jgi:hypothetical protein